MVEWLNNPVIAADITLEPDEHIRISRARIALILQKLPSEIDNEPWLDIEDVIAVYKADTEAAQRKKKP